MLHLTTIGTSAVFVGSRLLDLAGTDLRRVAVFWALAIAGIVSTRSVARNLCRRHASYIQKTLVVGSSPVARMIADKIERNPRYGLRLVGLVDLGAGDADAYPSPGTIGTVDELLRLVDEHDVGRVIVIASETEDRDLLDQIRELNGSGVQVDVLPHYHELLGPRSTCTWQAGSRSGAFGRSICRVRRS